MPLLGEERSDRSEISCPTKKSANSPPLLPTTRRQSQHSTIAKTAMNSHLAAPRCEKIPHSQEVEAMSDSKASSSRDFEDVTLTALEAQKQKSGHGAALTDTPASTAPSSPRM